MNVAENLHVQARAVDAISVAPDLEPIHEDELHVGTKAVARLPRSVVAQNERVLLVAADAHAGVAELETVQPSTMRLVVLEAEERQGAHVNVLDASFGQSQGQSGIETVAPCHLVEEAIAL